MLPKTAGGREADGVLLLALLQYWLVLMLALALALVLPGRGLCVDFNLYGRIPDSAVRAHLAVTSAA